MNCDPPFCASQVAGIIGVYQYAQKNSVFFVFLALGIELRALDLLRRHSTTWSIFEPHRVNFWEGFPLVPQKAFPMTPITCSFWKRGQREQALSVSLSLYLFIGGTRFELKALCLLGGCCTTWTTLQPLVSLLVRIPIPLWRPCP
jgi:hypothetical protein